MGFSLLISGAREKGEGLESSQRDAAAPFLAGAVHVLCDLEWAIRAQAAGWAFARRPSRMETAARGILGKIS